MGTNCAPLIADLFLFLLYRYEKDFMSYLHKSKKLDLVDKFNDTSRYIDDTLTIDYPEFDKVRHLSNSYVNLYSSIKFVIPQSHIWSHIDPASRWPVADQLWSNRSVTIFETECE